MTKQKWLNEQIFVDEYGRDYNLSDVPMTLMVRRTAYKKRGMTKEQINNIWEKQHEVNK